MTYSLIIRRDAEVDVREAFHYYETCRVGLGHEFLLCVEQALSAIVRFPLVHREVRGRVRSKSIHRFPYGIHYVVSGSRVSVIAVMHLRSDPKRLLRRE